MVRTRSGLGSGNQQPEPQVIEHEPEVVATPKPIMMAVVQAMIQIMLDSQMEGIRRLLQHNKDEPTMPVEQPEMNFEQSDEGNYSQTVSQMEPLMVRRNNPERRIDRDDACIRTSWVLSH